MISISRIKLFKQCRRAYELKYVYGIVPAVPAESLSIGRRYHELIELIYSGEFEVRDFTKEEAMACAYQKYVAPFVPIETTEKWFEKPPFHGRVDGIMSNGTLVEHKTTSFDVTEEYEYYLQWDEQIPMYMYLSGAREMIYTVCKKPTIRQKKNETDEEFFNRMVEWYDEETEKKIRFFKVTASDDEIEEFTSNLQRIAEEMKTDNFYRNTCACRAWNRPCEYQAICMKFNPELNYVGYEKKGDSP